MKRPEDRLHEQVWDALRYALPSDAVCTSHENRQNGAREGARRKRRGCLAGWPDIQILWRGRTYLIELKALRGTLSDAQREMHARIEAAGVCVAVCRSVDDVFSALTEWGFELRAEVAA
ncbi:VRR-NUC domain-containing protein [Gluconobacter thailandicus]|uniref:VRR-NUC domain-containing protein n=1 Tax=Gluconobacter thailandicus TaxID=257438 RepID=A0AAP9JIV3_GLUTH|nr:VRR-NUC domain-containing protein [Gluconobacter thailandicus]QEH97310.1 VRR-NUC domain-containing protein [Gluconobacter thailandicus]